VRRIKNAPLPCRASGAQSELTNMILNFGRHKGKRLDQVPVSYLRWMLANCGNISPAMRAEIKSLLCDKAPPPGRPSSIALPDLANRWYRQLSKEFHPDCGGSHQAMVAVNRGRELLLYLAKIGNDK
jgi:hypothetical protein